MADPKIKYDIEAAVSGQTSVESLEKILRGLAGTLDGDLKTKALSAADALKALSASQQAIETFKTLKAETNQVSQALNAADRNFQALAGDLRTAQASTQAMIGAQAAAAQVIADTKAKIEAQRAALVQLRTDNIGAARSTDAYKDASATLKTGLAELRASLKQQNDDIKVVTASVKAAELAEKSLASEYDRSQSAARKLSAEVGDKTRALNESRAALKAVGIETTGLAQTEKSLGAAVLGIRTQVADLAQALKGSAAAAASAKAAADDLRESDRLLSIQAKTAAEQAEKGKVALQAETAAQREAESLIKKMVLARAAEAAAQQAAAEAQKKAAAAQREQAESDRLAAIQIAGLARARQAGIAALDAERAAQRDAANSIKQYNASIAASAAAAAAAAKAAAAEMREADRLLLIEERAREEQSKKGRAALLAEIAAQHEAEALTRKMAAARAAEAAAQQAAAEAQRKANEARREQADADRLALIQMANLARARQAGQAALEAERAAQRDAAKAVEQYNARIAAAAAAAAAEQKRLADAAKAAAAELASAFQTVGVRSAAELRAEITRVRAAMETIRTTSGVTGAGLQSAFSAGNAKIRELELSLRQVEGTLTLTDKARAAFSSGMGQITGGNLIANGISFLASKISEIGPAFWRANTELESTRRALDAIYKNSAVAAGQLDFLRRTADQAGVSASSLSKSFVSFSAATKSAGIPLETTNALFGSVTKAGATLGLSTDRVSLVLQALGQMASKGCHAPGTMIRMADGRDKPVESIMPGEELMGPDGLPRKVLMLASGIEEMFRITPEKGDAFVVNRSHKARLLINGRSQTIVLGDFLASTVSALWLHEGGPVRFEASSVGDGQFHGFLISGDHLYLDSQGFEHHNTVAMEELRGQLGESLPGALSLAAKGLGLTELQLINLVSSGKLAARDLFPALAESLKSMEGDTNTAAGSWERFKNALELSLTNVGDSGGMALLTLSLRALAAVLAAIVLPLAIFVETIFGAVKAAGVLVAAIVTLTNPLDALVEITDSASKRVGALDKAFQSAAGMSNDFEESQNGAAAAIQAGGQAATAAAVKIATATAAAQANAAATDGVALAQKIMGDSTTGLGTKWVQLSVKLGEVATAQEKQVAVSEKLAAAAKIEGDSIVALTKLRGNDADTLRAEIAASEKNVETLGTLASARNQGLATLQAELNQKLMLVAGNEAESKARAKEIADIRTKANAMEAEAVGSKNALEAAKNEATARRIALDAYQDNALAVAASKVALEAAMQVEADYISLEKQGMITKEAVEDATRRRTQAEALYKDALADSMRLESARASAMQSRYQLEQAGYNLLMAQADAAKQKAIRDGNEYAFQQAVIRQKEIEIKLVELRVTSLTSEAIGSIAVANATKVELEAKGQLTEVQKLTIENSIRSAEIKLKEAEATGTGVAELKKQLQELHNGTDAQKDWNAAKGKGSAASDAQTSALGRETGATQANTEALKAQQDALDRISMKYTNSANYTERQIDLLKKEANAQQEIIDLENKRLNRDSQGFSLDKTGKQTVNQGVETWMSILDQLKGYGVDDAAARKLAYEFTPDGGNLAPYSASAAQKKYGGQFGTIGFAIQQAAQQYLQVNPPADTQNQVAPLASAPPTRSTTVTVDINLNGTSASINTASQADANALVSMLKGLQSAAQRAS